jgi:hypothetical protein
MFRIGCFLVFVREIFWICVLPRSRSSRKRYFRLPALSLVHIIYIEITDARTDLRGRCRIKKTAEFELSSCCVLAFVEEIIKTSMKHLNCYQYTSCVFVQEFLCKCMFQKSKLFIRITIIYLIQRSPHDFRLH